MLFGKYVNKFYLKYWYHFIGGIVFLIVVDVAQLRIPELIGNVVSVFSNEDRAGDLSIFWTTGLENVNSYIYFLISLAAVGGVMFVGRIFWRVFINNLGVKVENDFRTMLFKHALELDVTYYNKQKTGALMSYFNNDLESIRSAFTEGIIFLIDGAVLGTLAIIKLFQIDWRLALISVLPLVLMGVCAGLIGKGISQKYKDQLNAFEKMSDFSQENFSGISVIKAFVREGHQMRVFAKLNKKNKDTNMAYLRLSIILDAVIDFLIYTVLIVIFLGGGYLAIYEPSFDVGTLTTFAGYFDSLIWPMIAIAYLINIVSQSYASLKKVNEFLDAPVTLKDVPEDSAKQLPPISGDITFKDFNFNYPDAKNNVLSNINLHIKAGENIGIVGKTGSGKSTFVKVLLKIYNIDDGKIFFDGKDINEWPAKTIRDNIGYVAQNAFLFSDLVANNISFGRPNTSQQEIVSAADFACIDGAIRQFKDGYKTIVGEKGTTLSGGQRQRIAMARAVIKNPPILILDDSVSAVDSETESAILHNIRKIRQDKTTVIVSSRISSVQNANHIIVMDKGKIIGYGTHEELLESCSLYKIL
ncbi:MAG: ABC transporter ATP-binding protein, partial [Bacilli bacterium]|nr:ABC transporter ATP-binding protein [Bacilli bacterium]